MRGGEGFLGCGCEVDGDVRLDNVCGGDVCLSGVGDVCVVIGSLMGFCGDVVSMSCLRSGFCLCNSGCWDGSVVFCGV